LSGKSANAERRCPRAGHAWSTFGPHAIGAERFVAVSSGTSFAQVAGAILGKQGCVPNPDKDEVLRFRLASSRRPSPTQPVVRTSKLAVNGSVGTL
jgi:hypothetical protein